MGCWLARKRAAQTRSRFVAGPSMRAKHPLLVFLPRLCLLLFALGSFRFWLNVLGIHEYAAEITAHDSAEIICGEFVGYDVEVFERQFVWTVLSRHCAEGRDPDVR